MTDLASDGYGGRLVLTADQLALLAEPTLRRAVLSLVPALVMLGQPAEIDGLRVFDDWRLDDDSIDLVLHLLDNLDALDELVAAMPEEAP